MFALWAVAGVLSAAAAGLILFRAANAASQAGDGDATSSIYRRQLAEIDDLAERGLIGEAEQRTTHAEAARRLLAATDRRAESWSSTSGRKAVLAAAVATPLAALAVYMAVGSPDVPDQPFAARLAGWRGGDLRALAPAEMAAVLRQAVRQRPADAEGFRYLGLAEGSAGDGPAAVRALSRAVQLAPRRIDLWNLLGVALVYEAQGAVTPQALAAFREASRLDPQDAVARFHIAQAQVESGDVAGGVTSWRSLAADLPAGDPRKAAVEEAIAKAGQTRTAVDDGQLGAIRGMVAGLAERLRAQPDDPAGWVRLVRAYAVLGETAPRDAALAQARARYAGRSDILRDLTTAAAAPPMEHTR